jgi:hypothetical protein
MGGCSDELRSSYAGNVNNYNYFSSDDIPCWDVSPYTFTYDPKRNIFAKRANALRKRYRHGAVTIGGNIWVLGGLDSTKEWVKEVDMYDPGTDRWLYIGDLPTEFKVSDFAIYAAANGEHIYVMGGYNDAQMEGGGVVSSMAYKLNVQQTLDRYHQDPSSTQKQQILVLSKISNLNDKRANINAVSFSHYIYVAGGYTTTATTIDSSRCKQPLDTVERYDMTNDTWRYVAMLHTAKANVGLIRYGDVFVAVGGDTATPNPSSSASCLGGIDVRAVNSMEIYSPLDGPRATWTNIPISPMDGRMHYVVFPWKETESILIFGGIIKGPEGCNCYFSSDKVLVYSSLDEKVMHYKDSHWFVMFSALTILSIVSLTVTLLRYRCRKKHNRSADDTSETMGIVMATHDVT